MFSGESSNAETSAKKSSAMTAKIALLTAMLVLAPPVQGEKPHEHPQFDNLATATEFQIGKQAFEAGEYETAMRSLRPLAEGGDAVSQTLVGWMLEVGGGVEQDARAAVRWYRRAAEQGSALAQFRLAQMYREGRGVPQNGREAMQWYLRAAKQGSVDAQHIIGAMYAKGKGVPQNNYQAYVWLSLAAANNKRDARSTRDEVAQLLDPVKLSEAQEAAAALWNEIGEPDLMTLPDQESSTQRREGHRRGF